MSDPTLPVIPEQTFSLSSPYGDSTSFLHEVDMLLFSLMLDYLSTMRIKSPEELFKTEMALSRMISVCYPGKSFTEYLHLFKRNLDSSQQHQKLKDTGLYQELDSLLQELESDILEVSNVNTPEC